MRFDLFTLQLLLTVCEEKSIARAADRENIAASAVSKRISDLETRLRMSLFHRTSKGLEPTAAAHTLVHHSRVVMRDLKQMEIELAHHAAGVSGLVRIFASVSTIIQHLPSDLRAFLNNHAAIRVELQEGSSQQAVAAARAAPSGRVMPAAEAVAAAAVALRKERRELGKVMSGLRISVG